MVNYKIKKVQIINNNLSKKIFKISSNSNKLVKLNKFLWVKEIMKTLFEVIFQISKFFIKNVFYFSLNIYVYSGPNSNLLTRV